MYCDEVVRRTSELDDMKKECEHLWAIAEQDERGNFIPNGPHEARRQLALEAEMRRTNALLEYLIARL